MPDLFNVFKAIVSIKRGGKKKKRRGGDTQGLNLRTKIKGCSSCEEGGEENDKMIWELKII